MKDNHHPSSPKGFDGQAKITIVHLYPEEMNIYGDMGNIIALTKRANWRDINTELLIVDKTTTKEQLKEIDGDIYFMGGGQDNDMFLVFDDLLQNKKEFITKEVANNKTFLLICGAFQLFGEYFLDSSNRTIKGLGIIPAETKAPGNKLQDRCLGNLATELTGEIYDKVQKFYGSTKGRQTYCSNNIVGFENHSGQTYFTNGDIKPIANVLYGKGNNAKQKIEGAMYKNVFGSYTHGSLLPKNPHITDMLLGLALQVKYGDKITLQSLDDTVEWQAHEYMKGVLIGK